MDKRPIKRSQRVVLTTLTAAGVVAVQACGSSNWSDEPSVEASPFASVAECTASGLVPASQCQTAYSQALANHEQAAPRFESRELCEEQFDNGQCQQRTAGGTSFWMPALAGFMVGRMYDRDRRSYYGYSGLYRGRRNVWYTGGANGGALRNTGSGWQAGASAFDRPTASPPIRTRSSVSRRGGFGARSRGGWGG